MRFRKLSRRDVQLLGWSAIPALAAFALVGWWAGSHDRFAWDPAAITGTGVATASLAFFTARLASTTSDDVSATRELARIERDRFAKEEEPWLVAAITEDVQDPASQVHFEIVNVGRGAAVDVRWELAFQDATSGTEPALDDPPRYKYLRIPAGETTNPYMFNVAIGGEPVPVGAGRFVLRVVYSDRDRHRIITEGPLPLNHWQEWFEERARDRWWGLPALPVSAWIHVVEHRGAGLLRAGYQ